MTEIVKSATMKNPAFWVCLVFSMLLIAAGFLTEPFGSIPSSILTAVGILFAFATLYEVHVAMKAGVDAKLKHGNTELSVGDLNDNNTQEENNELN